MNSKERVRGLKIALSPGIRDIDWCVIRGAEMDWSPPAMIVCSCNVLSDGQVKDCLGPGPGCPRTAAQVYQCLGCSPKCGRCARTIRAIMRDALGEAAHSACETPCAATCPLAHAVEHGHAHIDPPLHPLMAEA